MNKNIDTIIINGQHFNARTGHAVEKALKSTKTRNIDGVLPQHVTPAKLQNARPAYAPIKSTVKKPVMDIVRTPARNVPKRQPEPAKTLMRRSVTKPQVSLKRTTKVVVPNAASAAVAVANVSIKTSATVVDSKKSLHAKAVLKSHKISRFVDKASSNSSQVDQSNASLSSYARHAVVASTVPKPGLAKQPSMDMFERALSRAKSHEQTHPVKKTKSRTNLVASVLAVLMLAGFVGFQNISAMKLQYASSKAGFQAEMPNYRPSGFSVGKLSYQAGSVSLNYHSNSDSRAFAITQKVSSWDSQSLRDNFVANNGQNYRTADAAGRTIYLYGDNNATWVNGGVWYQVQTNGSLNERQLTDLASSM